MYHRLIRRGVDFIFTYGNATEENREIYEYGFELIVMYFINASALLLLGLVGRCFWETLILLFGFALQQSFAGGYHAMTHLRCFLLMLAGWTITMLLLPTIKLCSYLPIILALPGLLCVFLFAPVKHVNFPMSREKERKMKKIARLVAAILFLCVLISILFQKAMLASVTGMTLFLSAASILSAVIKEFRGKTV